MSGPRCYTRRPGAGRPGRSSARGCTGAGRGPAPRSHRGLPPEPPGIGGGSDHSDSAVVSSIGRCNSPVLHRPIELTTEAEKLFHARASSAAPAPRPFRASATTPHGERVVRARRAQSRQMRHLGYQRFRLGILDVQRHGGNTARRCNPGYRCRPSARPTPRLGPGKVAGCVCRGAFPRWEHPTDCHLEVCSKSR